MGTKLKKLAVYFLILLSIASITSCKMNRTMIDKTVVSELDLNKYLGTWYEIARFDHRFERGLVGVKANYSLFEDGKIKVVNSGFKGDLNGEYSEAIGKAKIPNPLMDPAKLKVSFFWIFYGDYYVLDLDEDYKWAVIGSSSDSYLWILSRTPQLDEELYNMLLKKIELRGYPTEKLIKVKQL